MITRKDYMKNSSALFNDYYAQFITDSTIDFIESNIGIDKLLTSKDKYLNDLYNHSRGGAGSWIWDSTPFNRTLLKALGESNSQSTATCIGKVCARILIAEHKAGV